MRGLDVFGCGMMCVFKCEDGEVSLCVFFLLAEGGSRGSPQSLLLLVVFQRLLLLLHPPLNFFRVSCTNRFVFRPCFVFPRDLFRDNGRPVDTKHVPNTYTPYRRTRGLPTAAIQ